jgi:hypothetical protein
MPLSGKQEEFRLKMALALCRHINPEIELLNWTYHYQRIAEELNPFRVSPYMWVAFGENIN